MIEKGKAGWYFKSSIKAVDEVPSSVKKSSKYTETIPSGAKMYPSNLIAPFDKSST
jgi:hypothetical protein